METQKLPTKTQFVFLKIVQGRHIEQHHGKKVAGTVWAAQAVALKAGWLTTRPGHINTWEKWYVITPAGEAAIEAYRAAKKA